MELQKKGTPETPNSKRISNTRSLALTELPRNDARTVPALLLQEPPDMKHCLFSAIS